MYTLWHGDKNILTLSELKEIIKSKYLHRGEFTLSSGAKSNKYFDIKSLMCSYEDSYFLEEPLLQITHHIPYGKIGGTELGGIPLAQFLAFTLGDDYCIIRKCERTHGLKKMIEGQPKSPILLVDDVISTGKTISDAAWTCINEGWGPPCGVLCVIDRMTEVDRLSLNVQPVYSLFKESDFD